MRLRLKIRLVALCGKTLSYGYKLFEIVSKVSPYQRSFLFGKLYHF
jgi:hypothetical protein